MLEIECVCCGTELDRQEAPHASVMQTMCEVCAREVRKLRMAQAARDRELRGLAVY